MGRTTLNHLKREKRRIERRLKQQLSESARRHFEVRLEQVEQRLAQLYPEEVEREES
jgi:hypothetical protein